MGITRKLLELVDKIMDNALDDPSTPRGLCKAAGAGVIEGMIDGVVIGVPAAIVTGIICGAIAKNK
jgi:hypothetical protein